MQAMHDLIYHREAIAQYDHLEFPGVVPRTFIGPLAVTAASTPLLALLNQLGSLEGLGRQLAQVIG